MIAFLAIISSRHCFTLLYCDSYQYKYAFCDIRSSVYPADSSNNHQSFTNMKYFVFAAIVAVVSGAISSPTKYETNGGFLPSSMRYYNEQVFARENRTSDSQLTDSNNVETKIGKDDRLQRFGASGYGTSGYPTSGTGVSSYAPMKIDLGGVVLGTLIGLGAILIIPKFAHIFSGGYRRSVEGEMESISDILSKVDKALEEHHIDSSICMQRVVCSYVQESQKNIASGQPNTLDDLIYSVTNNSMMSFILDGTAIQQAIKLGKTSDPESCTSLYSKCPISKENIMQVITSLLPA